MKVILLKDVKGIGKKNDVVDVKDGYGSNYLIPRGLAVMQTNKSMEVLSQQKEDAHNAHLKATADAKIVAKQLEAIVLEFTAKVGKDGAMFGTISYKQIEEELKSKYDIVIDKRKMVEKIPVDHIGYSKLKIELYKDVYATITVHVSESR